VVVVVVAVVVVTILVGVALIAVALVAVALFIVDILDLLVRNRCLHVVAFFADWTSMKFLMKSLLKEWLHLSLVQFGHLADRTSVKKRIMKE
jgi:hypothetical protein